MQRLFEGGAYSGAAVNLVNTVRRKTNGVGKGAALGPPKKPWYITLLQAGEGSILSPPGPVGIILCTPEYWRIVPSLPGASHLVRQRFEWIPMMPCAMRARPVPGAWGRPCCAFVRRFVRSPTTRLPPCLIEMGVMTKRGHYNKGSVRGKGHRFVTEFPL